MKVRFHPEAEFELCAARKWYARQKTDVFTSTFGAWQRSETPEETMTDIRSVFNRSMKRHHQ